MAETFALSQLVVPGTYIRVSAEGLIGAGGIVTGNIGIVGTARRVVVSNATETAVDIYGDTFILSDYATARSELGSYSAVGATNANNLVRGIEQLYLNGATTVFARALDPTDSTATGQDDYIREFEELAKDNVNILVAPELSTDTAKAVFGSVLGTAENAGKDIIAVIGSDASTVANISTQVPDDDRIVFVAPGIRTFDSAASRDVDLPGTYAAASVAGLLATLVPQSSPTNKALPGVVRLAQRFSYGEMSQLLTNRVMVLEQRAGVRVVRGITSNSAAFKQVTTRRIVDFAKAGIRQVSDAFIGKLNNQRVRKALQGSIDGFLNTMVQDEALIGYTVAVTASRADEIAGRAIVNAVLQPTFSIDFVAVTLVLE
jgi:hypothetical protein